MDTHPTRRFIMQILRLLVWTVIAVALVKFAFFPSTNDDIPNIQGDGTFALPTVMVTKGSIEQEISLDASVLRDESKPARATEAGEVVWLYVEDGSKVEKGAPIIQVKKTTETQSDDPEAPPQSVESYHNVLAPATGTLKLDALLGQSVDIGSDIGTIIPDTFHAQVPVTPDQLYSLQGLPKEAELAINDGPAPFTCTNLHTVTGVPTPNSGSDDSGGDTSGGPQLQCDIPESQLVFDGVKAKLNIKGGSVTDVLTIPVTAVEGRYREGNVYLPPASDDPTAKPQKTTIKLGISDGSFIEIKEGLSEGDEILEFVPRKNSEDEQDAYMAG